MAEKSSNREAAGPIHFAVSGSGPPMLLLHGVLRDGEDFKSILPDLAVNWRVGVLDFRGHGRAPWQTGKYRVLDYVHDAMEFLKSFSDAPAIVIGHSLGAMVAAAVAANLPDRVRAIVLEDPPLDTMGSRIGRTPLLGYFQQIQQLATNSLPVEELAEALAEVQLVDPDSLVITKLGETRDRPALQRFAKCIRNADPDVLSSVVDGSWLCGYDAERVFRRIRCPALLLQGNPALGGMLIDADAAAIETWTRHCTRVNFADVGHHIHATQPETMLRHIQSFVNALPLVESAHEVPSPHLRTPSHEDSPRRYGHSKRTTG